MDTGAILIVDDHPVFRFGLARALEARGFREVMTSDGSVVDAAMLWPQGTRAGPWAAVLDVRLGAVDGIELCRRLRETADPPVVVMLSTFDDPVLVQAAKDAGAFAYLTKGASADEIAAVVRAGLAGGAPRIRDQAVPTLTKREGDVLRLLCEGCSTKAIAERLGIAPTTAKDHLDRVYAKLDVSDRLNAVRVAHALGLVDVARHEP